MNDDHLPARDDLHKHLEFIQAVVTRMSAASTSTKSWLLPVVTAAYGYGMTQNAWSIVALGLGSVILFTFLDAHYLDRERAYRALYDAVARGVGIPLFSLDPRDVDRITQSAGRQIDITPDEAEDGAPDSAEEERRLKDLAAWIPNPSVWKSWSITPFYGPLVLVGLVLMCRLAFF